MANLFMIMYILRNCQYHHLHYNIFLIHDPKFRIIMSENINDKIVHHLCSQFLLFPILEKKIIIIFMFLKCDVHKFFYSIDHNCLMEKMKKIYLDEDILKLLKEIINSTNEEYVNQKIEKEIEKTKREIIQSKLSLKEKEEIIKKYHGILKHCDSTGYIFKLKFFNNNN